jgi:hypothetical protein
MNIRKITSVIKIDNREPENIIWDQLIVDSMARIISNLNFFVLGLPYLNEYHKK